MIYFVKIFFEDTTFLFFIDYVIGVTKYIAIIFFLIIFDYEEDIYAVKKIYMYI